MSCSDGGPRPHRFSGRSGCSSSLLWRRARGVSCASTSDARAPSLSKLFLPYLCIYRVIVVVLLCVKGKVETRGGVEYIFSFWYIFVCGYVRVGVWFCFCFFFEFCVGTKKTEINANFIVN